MSVTGPRLGVVMLCHAHLAVAARIARLWSDGGADVVLHVDAGADPAAFAQMQAGLRGNPRIGFAPRRACDWGRFDLVQATQDAAQTLLDRAPDVSHVLLASGSCLPLRPVDELTAHLAAHPGRDFIESVAVKDAAWATGGLNEERFTRYFPVDWRQRRKLFDRLLDWQRKLGVARRLPKGLSPHLGSQWWCLTRQTLSAILNDPRRDEYDRFFRLSWIPDESYFQTLARQHSTGIESQSLTLARFDAEGRPYLLYDDHRQMLQDSGCFVARKIWHGADGLLGHFPCPSPAGQRDRAPDPSRIEQMFSRAANLRRQGRPGLYMQSRFPSRDLAYGKTAAAYGVLQGFDDLMPGFTDWLADRIDADVHGHLFAPEGVEYAGGAACGPGALSGNAALRDHDPERFLASLLRLGDRMQIFQHGPGDTQDLNWFMATDPNARIMVVTGAWVVPLYRKGLPVDLMRGRAALLQRAEIEQVKILNSQWRRAQIRVWDLAAFAAAPQAVWGEVWSLLAPGKPVPADLPPLHDLSGLAAFLKDLRNAGLHPELTGAILPPARATDERAQP